MPFHIVLNRPSNLGAFSDLARRGLNPRHSMAVLADALGAIIHDGADATPDVLDRLLAKMTKTAPLWWTIARTLRRQVKPGDVVYCTGEDIGFPVAALCGGLPGVRVALMAHHIDSLKKRAAMRLLDIRNKVSLFCTVSPQQAAFLRRSVPPERVLFVWDQTDTRFFSPGKVSASKPRPIVMSVGLEKRDYGLLAEATSNMDIDVRISGFSADTRVLSRAFPKVIPQNMSRRFYAWRELQQLYRDADVVVICLFPNRYAAGVQGLMEGLASGRAVVVTATKGLEGYLDDGKGMRLVAPGDVRQMREAIADLLARPGERQRLADEALALANERHRCEGYVEVIASALHRLAAAQPET